MGFGSGIRSSSTFREKLLIKFATSWQHVLFVCLTTCNQSGVALPITGRSQQVKRECRGRFRGVIFAILGRGVSSRSPNPDPIFD